MRSATRLFADRKLFAVFAVALMLFSTVAVVSNLLQVSEADYVGDQYVVTYDVGDIPIGNWQYNKINENASVSVTYYGTPIAEYNPQYWDGNITGSVSGNPGNWNAITCYVNDETLVFTGWSETKGGESGEIDPGDVLEFENGVKTKTLYACWGTLLEYKSVSGANTTADFVKYDKYRYVLGINGNVKLGGPNDSSTIGGCTVVSAGPDGYPAKSKFDYYNQDSLKIDGELIVENITMMGHGATTTQDVNGYYARGNQIIIGANVSCEGNVQIYGGWKSASDQSSEGPAYTDVRIFSGKYSNVIGGSSDNIEVSITKTNVLIAGTTSVVESVIGGSIGKRGSNSTKLVEQTNILIVSGNVDTNGYKDVSKTQIRGDMSTVIGGSRYGYVGTTNVEVSGDASVFAVQGGGRQASSKADTTNVTISGQAHIIHMVCGSVTDGNPTDPTDPTEDHFPVGDSHISVRDSPQIGNVYGGGWDIWQKPDGPSTRTTDVDIRGNPTIGGVYGGGFRGTVGDGGLTVSITVAGGNIDAVYGGGSGGEDPVINANNGNKGPGAGNKTGPAEVNGDVSILITGGEVGEVYGGGQGAPDGNTYCGSVTGDITISVTEGAVIHGDIYGGGYGVPDNPSVASASGTVNIAILGGSVGGSVYGGGNLGYIQGDIKISILGGKVSGNVFGGGNGQDGGNGSAKVYGSVNITVGGSGVEGPGIGGSVFGGGNGVQIKDSGGCQ